MRAAESGPAGSRPQAWRAPDGEGTGRQGFLSLVVFSRARPVPLLEREYWLVYYRIIERVGADPRHRMARARSPHSRIEQ